MYRNLALSISTRCVWDPSSYLVRETAHRGYRYPLSHPCWDHGLAGEFVAAYTFSYFADPRLNISICLYHLLYSSCAADLEIAKKALVI